MNWQNIRKQFHRGNFNFALKHIEANISSLSSIGEEKKEFYLQELIWLKTQLGQLETKERGSEVFSTQAGGLLAFLRELERLYMDSELESDYGFSTPKSDDESLKSFVSVSFAQNFPGFTDEHELIFKNQILSYLNISPGDLNLVQRKSDSIAIEVELPLVKEKEFLFGILRGCLKDYKIIAARILNERYLDAVKEDHSLESEKTNLLIKESPEFITELYKNITPWMRTIAYTYFKDSDQAYDVSQKVLLRILEKDKLREIKSNTRNFILTALHNECKNIINRMQNRSRLLKEKENILFDILFPNGHQDSINNIDLEKIMTRTQEILNEEQNLVLVLKHQGYNYREIGKRLNKTENNARQIRHKAVTILRNDPFFNEILKR